jgi:sugar phosphate isomerase/epimerase
MKIRRRAFLGRTAALAAAALAPARLLRAAGAAKFKVGVTDWNLKQTGKLEAVRLALDDRALQQAYLAESKRVGLPLASLCLDILHTNGLKSDPLGQRWVAESIGVAKNMGLRVILLPFFGKWAMTTTAEMDYVGDALKEVAPAAEKAGVILGLEDTISAKDNVRIMERAKSPAVLTYYDVGNSTNNGFDVVPEIRWLGKQRICEVHLKDNPSFLGQGKIDFPAIVGVLADIGFAEWAQLETSCPTGSVEADMAVNLKYVRDLMAARAVSD